MVFHSLVQRREIRSVQDKGQLVPVQFTSTTGPSFVGLRTSSRCWVDEDHAQTGSSLPIPSGLLRIETFYVVHRLLWPSRTAGLASLCLHATTIVNSSVFPKGEADTLHRLNQAECSNHWLNIVCWTKEYSELLKWPISQSWKTDLFKSLSRKQWQSRLEPQLPLRRAHRSGCGLNGKVRILLLSEFLAPVQGLSVNNGAIDINIWCLWEKAHIVNKNTKNTEDFEQDSSGTSFLYVLRHIILSCRFLIFKMGNIPSYFLVL